MVNRKISSLAYTSFAHFTNDGNFLLFPLLIEYEKFAASFIILTIGAIAIDLVSGFVSPFIGRLADRTNAHAILIAAGLSIEGFSVAIFSMGFFYPSSVDYFILIGTLVLGLGQSFYHPLGGTVLSMTFTGERYGRALGINGSMGSVGRALTPFLLALLIPYAGHGDSFLFIAAFELFAALIIVNGLRWIKRTDSKTVKEQTRKAISPESLKKYRSVIYTLAAVVFIRSIFSSGVVTFLPYYIGVIFSLSPFSSLPNYMISIAFIAPIFGQPIFGVLTSRLGGKYVITITSTLAVLFTVLFVLTHSVYVMTASMAGFAFSVFSGFPVLIGYVQQLVPRDILTASSSLVWGVGSTVGGALGIVVFYISYKIFNLSVGTSMWILIAIGLVSVFLIPLLPKRDVQKERAAS